ncbi:MAG: hypothetical protein K8I03_11815 [Ignavibacteria bacterium]|nr:hypothetical protein [Ignavibacteria bacterium]
MKKIIPFLLFFVCFSGFAISQDVKTLSGHTGNINSIDFAADASKMISACSDGKIIIWKNQEQAASFSPGGNITCVRYTPDGKEVGVTILNGECYLMDAETGNVTRRFESRKNCYNICFSKDGKYIAVNSFYKTDHYYIDKEGKKVTFQKYHFLVDLYSTEGGKAIKTLMILEDDRQPLFKLFGDDVTESYRTNNFTSCFTIDSKYLAIANPNSRINIYSFDKENFIRDFTGHDKNVYSVAFSADGNYLASGSKDEDVKVWNISTGKTIKTLSGHESDINSVYFSPDSKYVVSASDDETVRVWDISSGKQVKSLKGHQGDVVTVSFSPDGRYIASGGKDGKVKLWNTEVMLPEMKLFTAQFDANVGIYAVTSQEKEAELKAVIEEYFKPKGEFETTDEYNSRIETGRIKKQEIEDKYKQKLEDQQVSKQIEVTELKTQQDEEREKKIRESVRDTVLKIDNLGNYDADTETYTLTIKNKTGKIVVPRIEAPGFKENWKKAEVKCKKILNDNLKYYNYYDIIVVHPVTKTEYIMDDGSQAK